MAKVVLLVSISDEYLDRFCEVVGRIKVVGMDIEQEMEDIGVVSGVIDSESIELLRNVEGVSQVEQSQQIQIAPPDSNIQ